MWHQKIVYLSISFRPVVSEPQKGVFYRCMKIRKKLLSSDSKYLHLSYPSVCLYVDNLFKLIYRYPALCYVKRTDKFFFKPTCFHVQIFIMKFWVNKSTRLQNVLCINWWKIVPKIHTSNASKLCAYTHRTLLRGSRACYSNPECQNFCNRWPFLHNACYNQEYSCVRHLRK